AHRLLLVPDMVAGGDHVGAGGVELGAQLLGDAEAAGGVLAIDHDEIERQLAAQPRQLLEQRLAPRPSDDIAEKQPPHRTRPSPAPRSRAGPAVIPSNQIPAGPDISRDRSPAPLPR